MADINVTINPAPSVSATVSAAAEVDVTIGEGIPKHAVTHAPGGSDSLESYYATTGSLAYVSGLTSGAGDTGYLTGYVSKTETGNFYPSSNPSGFITGVDLSNYVTGQVVRPSETGDFITNSETGVFYPTSNPSGFITGVDLSSYATTVYVTGVSGSLQTQITNLSNSTGSYVTGSVVRPSETGVFVTTGQTGQFVTGSVVRPSETGDFVTNSETGAFYPASNPSGFITGVDLSAYVTGQVVRPSETGDFVTNSQTGAFYPASNPSGFITGVDLSGYVTGSVVRPSETGDFITTSQTGSFYPTSNPSGFITGVDLSAYVTGDVVRPSETGLFLTTGAADTRYVGLTGDQTVSGIKNFASRPTVNGTGVLLSGEGGAATNTGELTGVFYPLNSNPSGYITGVDLSSYATQSFVTGVSGHLQGQVNTLNGQTGNYVTGSVVRPSETGNFVTADQTGVFVTGDVVRPSETGDFVTTSQTGAFYSASNPSGFITGVDLSAYVTGDVVRPSETGAFLTTGAADGRYVLQSTTGDFITTAQTGAFYPVSNPSGFITGVDLSAYATTVYVTGVSGHLQGQINTLNNQTGSYVITGQTGNFITTSQTGQFVGDGETGAFLTTGAADGRYALQSATGNFITADQTGQFYPTSNPSGYVTGSVVRPSDTGSFLTTGAADSRYALQSETGVFVTTGQTGQFVTGAVVRPTETGAFLTTGAADARYYGLQNGQSISGYAITGYNDAVTGMSVTGDTTKTITLFQREGTTVTANFADNAGSGSSDTGYLTGYVSKTETGNIAIGTITLVIDGGGSAITTGYKGFTTVNYNGSIDSYTLLADQAGTLVIDVWKDTYANYPPTDADSITNGNEPHLTAVAKYTETCTGWSPTTITAGDVLSFNVDSATTITKATLTLKILK